MRLIGDVLYVLTCLVRAVRDALLRRGRCRYAAHTDIKAPRDAVWRVLTALEIVFEGAQPIVMKMAPRPGAPGVLEGTVTFGERSLAMAVREIESRPPEAILMEILEEGSDPQVALGHDYYVACVLEPRGEMATRLSILHELTHRHFAGRLLVPLGARFNARRFKTYCEKEAGTAEAPASRLGAALMTGALTYASFGYLFDWTFAAILLLLLIVHEGGHALAMRWVGLPVQGIYFIPFMGGVAVAAAPHRTEAERGFVALMGPGFSLVSTAAFLAGALATGDPLLGQLAFASAILNGLNLAPVLPLDGGQIVDAALSRSDPEFVSIINMLALIAGTGLSIYLEWHVLTALLVLTAPMVLRPAQARRAAPISASARTWLLAGYFASIAFYAAIVARVLV